MLAKQYRLPPFEKLVNTKNISSEYFRVLIKPNSLPYSRYGFVISKKIDKKAVARNRMRRVLSEVVKNYIQRPGNDVLIIVKKSFIDESTDSIIKIFQPILEKQF